MEKSEKLVLQWMCLFDDFQDSKFSNIKDLVSSVAFKEFANNVFCFKCSTSSVSEDENFYNTVKANCHEFEIQKYENLYDEENCLYSCVVVLLHALLKCTNDVFREQLCKKMNSEEQVLLATFLEATQSLLFTKQNIFEALISISSSNVPEIDSNNSTPIKTKSMQRSYLQEFCQSPKTRSLLYQEKEKLIAKLSEEYKNECEENYKLHENIKTLHDLNTKLRNKLEDKEKVIKCLKDEIEEFSMPKDKDEKVDYVLKFKKLNQDILDLEINNTELKQQITELENNHKVLNDKYEIKTADYENLLLIFDNIENDNMSLKENINLLKMELKKKETEIISLKDELCNKSVSNNPMNSSCQEASNVPSNTLFDELSCIKLEEVTHDKEKYRHKYKSVKKDLLNTENQLKDLGDQITTLKTQLHDCETDKNKLTNKLSDKKKEFQEIQKKNNNLESKIKHLITDKENHIESMRSKLDKKENQIKGLSVELDSVKKAKNMIELILSKTNTEIEVLHEENNKYVNNLLATIDDNKKSIESSQTKIIDLENNIKIIQDDLANKENIIIFYEDKMAENYQVISNQEEQLKIMYEEKLALVSHLKNMKCEMETQQKVLGDKNHEMEKYLEYYLDELKDIKNTKTQVEEMLRCKQNEIDRQAELITYQKNLIETLQSEKCNQETNINNLNDILQQKTIENEDFKEKVTELTLNLNKLKEEHYVALNEKIMLEENQKIQMKTLSDEFQCQICDMNKELDSQNHKVIQLQSDCLKLKEALETKQNDFNEQLILSNKHIETLSSLRLEVCELEKILKLTSQDLHTKEHELKSLEDKVNQSTIQIKNLTEEVNLKTSENKFLTKNLELVTLSIYDMQNNFEKPLLNMKTNLQLYYEKINTCTDKLLKFKSYLHSQKSKLETQIDLNNKQNECILLLKTEKLDLLEKLKISDQCFLNKKTEVSNLEKELNNLNFIVKDLEEKLGVMSIEKVIIETNLNETSKELKNVRECFTEQINKHLIQLSNSEKDIIKWKNQSSNLENILEEKQKLFDEQSDILKDLKSTKEVLEKQVLNNQTKIKSLLEELDDCKSSISNLEKKVDHTTMEKSILETKLRDTINEKEFVNKMFEGQIKNIQNCLTESQNDLINKQIQLDQVTEENNKLKESIDFTQNLCTTLENELKMVNDCIVKKDDDIKALSAQCSAYLSINESLEKQMCETKQSLNDKHVELENQIQCCNEQRETIVKINCEKEFLCDKIKILEDAFSHKESKLNLCEGKLNDCSDTINNLENKLEQLEKDKSSLELHLNETIIQLTNENKNLSVQLEHKNQNVLQTQEKNIHIQGELDKQIEQSNKHMKTISLLNLEKDSLLLEINKLQECLNEKQCVLNSLQIKVQDCEKQYEELLTLKINLESELDVNKTHLENVQQESKYQLEVIESKYTKLQEELNAKMIEINECNSKYDCQIESVALLKSERDNLINENNAFKNTLTNNDRIIEANQEKLIEYENKNKDIKKMNIALELEVKQISELLEITRQDLTKCLEEKEKIITDLQEKLNCEHINLETQLKEAGEQKEVIFVLTSEKDYLVNEINLLKNQILEKEDAAMSNHIKLINLETQLEELQIQRTCFESKLHEFKIQSDNIQQDLTRKLESTKTKLQKAEEQLIILQVNFEKQNKCLIEQTEQVNILTSEKNNLVQYNKRLDESLAEKISALSLNQDKLEEYCKHNTEIECQNTALMLELNQLKCQCNHLQQESSKKMIEMDKKLLEAQEKLNNKQFEIKKQVKLKNDSLAGICQKINDLKIIKSELELVLEKEKTDFLNCLETFSNYSLKKIKWPLIDDHQDSVMEVISSADTFIKENGIELVKVENYDEYSVIERLKKLFEALKMFILNINTQGNERTITHTNNDKYAELLCKSNKQLEIIKRLESEMSDLKIECNYKMTKVQQKTQEYVTSEYEKKFERKREQMKQFCKDLETRIHQDYEAKLIKYKEKINKDEIHIKELGQQLWEVSEKYLKLQQKDRRVTSLPYEMSTMPRTTAAVPFKSFTLPKSSSAGQIRSLIEENTRSYQENSKRNVPVGIGKKFSLSSGKIFPKEEDEEGEMFNHSCLADLKQGKVRLYDSDNKQYSERLSELQARNSLCPPHLRSCYAVETNYLPNSSLITEEEIKTLANYSDCESENLIPNDRNKKKDRNQTLYKRPGPPTPSKNGGRASLPGNTKIVLKEQKESSANNKRRLSSTPNKLFSLFMSKKN